MSGFRIEGSTSGNVVEVNASNQLKVTSEVDAINHPNNIGGFKMYSENDQGVVVGTADLTSPESDVDYRLRISQDAMLDEEVFNYTAQNTGKHAYTTGTITAAWTAGNLTTNSANTAVFTTGTGAQIVTYASFPNNGTQTLSGDFEVGFSAQPTTNVFIEFGLGIPGLMTAAPTDGVFFRLSSAGLQGICSNNGTETSTGVFPLSNGTGTWVYTNNKKYQFIVYVGGVSAQFWANDGVYCYLLGQIQLPTGQGRVCMASGLQMFFKHRVTGGSSTTAIQGFLGAYNIRLGGINASDKLSTIMARAIGTQQGMSGGTMGSLATYVNSTNATAAAPSNTALTANLPGGLGGQGTVTAAVAAATDGIWNSFQVPAGTVSIQGRRLKITGLRLDAVNTGAAVATTATTIQFSLAFGHTSVSLATAEAAAAKAPRRVPLGIMSWAVAAAIGQGPQSGPIVLSLDNPIYVNPGEFIALVGKFLVGTATASQTISFTLAYDYGWE